MKKLIKKCVIIAMSGVILGETLTAYAANNFTFAFHTRVIGKKEFNLQNEDTRCVSNALTYVYNTDEIANNSGNYCIDLSGSGLFSEDYDGVYVMADGTSKTTNYGTVEKNIYTVNVNTTSNLTQSCREIIGSGELNQ